MLQDPGLNVDLMSYSMSQLVDGDQQALLNPQTLMDTANQTFSIFFKHFACFNVSEQLGGYVYAKPTLDHRTSDWIGAYGGPVNATLNTPVDELRMSPTAAILSISILVFLIIVTIIIYTTNRREYKAILRDVDTLASTLGWVYASDRLLAWAAVAPPIEPHSLSRRAPFTTAHKARMGPFRDSAGNEHWGIEIVDTDTDDLKGNGKEDNSSRAAFPAVELIELQTRKHLNTYDSREDLRPDIHKRLLKFSDTETQANDGASDSPESCEHDKSFGRRSIEYEAIMASHQTRVD